MLSSLLNTHKQYICFEKNCSRKNLIFLFGTLINLTVRVDTYFHPIRMTYPIHPRSFFRAAENWGKFGAKPDKGFGLEISDATGSRQGNARESGVGRRNPQEAVGEGRRRVAVGSRHWTAEETSRHEIGSRSSEERPVRISWHSR